MKQTRRLDPFGSRLFHTNAMPKLLEIEPINAEQGFFGKTF